VDKVHFPERPLPVVAGNLVLELGLESAKTVFIRVEALGHLAVSFLQLAQTQAGHVLVGVDKEQDQGAYGYEREDRGQRDQQVGREL
jgi:hypothetical protein